MHIGKYTLVLSITTLLSTTLLGTTCIRVGSVEAELNACPKDKADFNAAMADDNDITFIKECDGLNIFKVKPRNCKSCDEYLVGLEIKTEGDRCSMLTYAGTTGHSGRREEEIVKKTESIRKLTLKRLDRSFANETKTFRLLSSSEKEFGCLYGIQ